MLFNSRLFVLAGKQSLMGDIWTLSVSLASGDFQARSRFARSTIPEEKWGLLVVYLSVNRTMFCRS